MDLLNENSCLMPSLCSAVPPQKCGDARYLEEMYREISKPLSAIIGLSYILSNMDCSKEQKQECVVRLHESSEMLMKVIKDMQG